MTDPVYTFVIVPLIGWFVALSLSVVGYLAALQLKEMRRNRRMNEVRSRLGLDQA